MKNNGWIRQVVLVLGLVFFFGCASESAKQPDNYTATMVTMGIEMPMAKMGSKSRVENPMMNGVVTITEVGSGKVIMMSTAGKTFLEQVAQDEVPSIDDPGVVVEKKKTGTETLDGHACVTYDIVLYKKDNPEEKYRGRVWEAIDLGGLVIRNEMEVPEAKQAGGGTMVFSLKDVKIGAATPAMFEVPSDYRRVDNVMELMSGGRGIPGRDDMQKMKEMMERMYDE